MFGIFQTQLIVSIALLEGAAFFAGVGFLLERQYIALGVALGLMMAMLLRFPTRAGLDAWMSRTTRIIDDARNMARPQGGS